MSPLKKNQVASCFSLILVLCSLLLIIGCQTTAPRGRNSIVVGMPRRDVILLMGTPAKQHQEEGREVLQFALHQDINAPYAPDEPYWVFLEEGKVVKHGRGKDFETSQPQEDPAVNAKIRLA